MDLGLKTQLHYIYMISDGMTFEADNGYDSCTVFDIETHR